MSVKVIAQLNPFSMERTEFSSDGKTVQEIINNIDVRHTSATAWRVLVNDEIVTDFSRKIEDNDTVYLKLVPEGDMDNKKLGTAGKVGGSILTVIGVIVGICTSWTGVGGFIGAAIAGAGVSLLAGGIVLYNTDIPSLKERKKPEQDPSIRGSRNQMRQMGYVPILLGKRRIYCDLASYSYTWVDPADGAQYLYQLFCIGQKDLQVDTSTIKIDETLLSDYSATGNINSILSGNDPLINMSISYGGSTPPLMEKCVHEDQFNTVLKKRTSEDTDGSVIRTTPDGTSEINVDIFFYNGLGRYDDEGNIQSASVTVMAWYKPADYDDSAYQVLGHFNNGSDTISGNELKTKRYAITKSGLEPGRWTVKISRITDDSSDSKVIDDVYVGSIRSLKNESPVSERRCRELSLVGLKIKASEKLNNVVDQLNLVAQSVLPVYENGVWTTALSSNPASAVRYAMQGELSQQRLPDSEIDIPALERLYTWCKNHNYECNAYVTEEMTISELLSSIGSTCRTEIFRMNGKITAVQDIERDSFVQLFSPRNSWGYKETIEFPDIPESMTLQIVDKNTGYAENEIVIYNTPSGNKSENTGTTSQDVQLWGVTDSEQARKIGMYKYAVSRCRPIVHQFSCDFEYMMCTKGDWIQYAGDMALAGITQGRITRVILDGSGHAVAVETDEEIDATGSASYGIRIRLSDGSVVIADVENEIHVGKQIVFTTPLAENIPSEGDLFLFGYRGHEAIDLIITDIQCGENLSADITCVEYAPEIFGVDSPDFVLPDWENKLSDVPGIVDDGNVSEWRTWTTFHDGAGKPSRPKGDGTDDGWHRLQTTESMWMSTKNAPTVTSGIWSSPVPTAQQVVAGGESIGNPDNITGLTATAARDYVQLSWDPVGQGLRNSVQYYALQVSFNAGSSWTDAGQSKTNSFDYELSRKGTNYPKYPEATDFANWRFRVKVRSIYNNESSWTACTVDTTSYGTWILSIPDIDVKLDGRFVTLTMRQPARADGRVQYGNIRYGILIRRPDTDAPGVWWTPGTSGDPVHDVDAYKDVTHTSLERNSPYIQRLPLLSATPPRTGYVMTEYQYRIVAVNEAGSTAANYRDVNVTANFDNIRDFVEANAEQKSAIIEKLSAISANLGEITGGSFGGGQYNYWTLTTALNALPDILHGNRDFQGAFQVGDDKQYIRVVPKLDIDGHTIIGYEITIKVGKFEISSEYSKLNGEFLIQAEETALDRTRLSPRGTFYEHRDEYIANVDNWYVVAKQDTGGILSQKLYSEFMLLISNTGIKGIRNAGLDVGNQYLSEASRVYHFDTDEVTDDSYKRITGNILDQYGQTELALTLGQDGYASEVGSIDSDFYNKKLQPAIQVKAPYSETGNSLYGQFMLTHPLGAGNAWTVDFWFQHAWVEGQEIFKVQTDRTVIFLASLLDEPYYNSSLEEEPPYNTESAMTGDNFVPYNAASAKGCKLVYSHGGLVETVNLDELGIHVSTDEWIHAAVIMDSGNVTVLLSNEEFVEKYQNEEVAAPYISKTFIGAGSGGDFTFNSTKGTVMIDELLIDKQTAESAVAFASASINRIPWAALSDDTNRFLLIKDENSEFKTNINFSPYLELTDEDFEEISNG